MPFFDHDGLRFHYLDSGGPGIPFLFQHGLGGDVAQPVGLFSPPESVRLLCLDCRAHGRTEPLGEVERIGIAAFAADARVLLDRLGIECAVVGGISLGAAVALRFAFDFPERVQGLVLSRPAWLAGPMERNARIYGTIAGLLRAHGAVRGREHFLSSDAYRETLRLSPDSAASLLGQFENPRSEETVVKLERIPLDTPIDDLSELEKIAVPTLILASRQDPIHPYEYGEILARAMPRASFVELVAKSVSKEEHAAGVQTALEDFLRQFAGSSSPQPEARKRETC